MQVRVVADQPWDVKADVLAVPILGQPDFGGPLGELDKRSGGELKSLWPSSASSRASASRASSRRGARARSKAGRLLAVLAGDADDLDRETVLKLGGIGRAAARRPQGAARWRSGSRPLADALEGGAAAVAELVARGVVEGSYDPASIYREGYDEGPPEARRADPRRARRGRRGAQEGRGAGRDHRRGREHRADPLEPQRRTTSAPRSSPRRPGASPRSTACGSTSSAPRRPSTWAWACSWRSGGAATTRPG